LEPRSTAATSFVGFDIGMAVLSLRILAARDLRAPRWGSSG
jgi:hypothetical protein